VLVVHIAAGLTNTDIAIVLPLRVHAMPRIVRRARSSLCFGRDTRSRSRVQTTASAVISQLAVPSEYEPLGGGVLVDQLPTREEDYPEAERFKISFGTRDGWRAVDVAVVPNGEAAPASIAWAAYQLADAFQDEVIEMLWTPRPACPGHSHPMAARVDGPAARAWWECPTDSGQRHPLWPS
jgi:hypothetical protein